MRHFFWTSNMFFARAVMLSRAFFIVEALTSIAYAEYAGKSTGRMVARVREVVCRLSGVGKLLLWSHCAVPSAEWITPNISIHQPKLPTELPAAERPLR